MIRIGEFSRISQVSIKTLRFYDEVGLLHPAQVDDFTGYRYYTFSQLARLHRILALKEMGFPLEQIGHLLDDEVSPDQLRGMLKARRAEIKARLDDEMERLARVEARLKQIEEESIMSQIEVVIKKVEPQQIASVRDIIPTYAEQGGLWGELEGYLAMQRVRPVGACLTIYHDEEYKERDVDAEVCEPIGSAAPGESRRVKVRTLPAAEVASAVHRGPYVTLGKSIQDMIQWLEANGYHITGPEREIYLQPGRNGSQNDPETVTEVQFPVEKV
ncbi:MAG: MerR family transcriptional regulator [Chloroflexi bacterium]|nr:MAG: MerR family transcriptional regulator [Chloroflexota bacterium]